MSFVRSYNRAACLLCVLGITSYIMATFYIFQPALLIALCGLPAVVLAWHFSSRHRLLLPRWAVNGMLLAAVCYAALKALQGVSVEVIAELVVFIQIIKLCDRRSPRDDAQVISLAIFLAIAAMLTSNQFWVGLQLFAFVPLLIATVMLYQLYSSWFAAGPGPHRPAPTISGKPPLRWTVVLATLGTVVVSLFVFVVMPRGVGENVLGNWQMQQAGARTAFTDHVKLGSSGIISVSPRIVLDMLVRSARPGDEDTVTNLGGPDAVYYLRGAVLDQYQPGTGLWESGHHRPPRPYDPNSFGQLVDIHKGLMAYVRQDIALHGIGESKATLFCLWHPARIEVGRNTSRVEVDLDAATVRRTGQPGPFEYTVWSALNEPAGDASGARTPASFESAPIHDLSARVLRELGIDPDPATRPIEDDARAARAIQDHLHKSFGYTLVEHATPTGMDPIEHFLFTTREGHCEYFAGAMVVMCRSVGINTRMVAGYVAAEFSEATGRYVVRESNAHAWVEAETTPGSWRRFDPTPPADLARLHKPRAGLLASLRRAMESVEYAWNTGVVGFDEGARQRLFGPGESRRYGIMGAFDGLASRMQLARPGVVLAAMVTGLMVFLGAAGAGLLLQWVAVRLAPILRRRTRAVLPVQARLSPERRSQVRFYARLLETLRARGLGKPQWRPPLAHAAFIRGADAGASDRASRLTRLYYAATFGDRVLSQAELAQAESLLAELAARTA